MCWLQTKDSGNKLQFPDSVPAKSTALLYSNTDTYEISLNHLSDTIYPILLGSCLAWQCQQSHFEALVTHAVQLPAVPQRSSRSGQFIQQIQNLFDKTRPSCGVLLLHSAMPEVCVLTPQNHLCKTKQPLMCY